MYFIYNDTELKSSFGNRTKYDDLPASKFWITHYSNFCYLDWMSKHPDTSFAEKAQAKKELLIAQRKMDYWKRHPNWQKSHCENEANKIKSMWLGKSPKGSKESE